MPSSIAWINSSKDSKSGFVWETTKDETTGNVRLSPHVLAVGYLTSPRRSSSWLNAMVGWTGKPSGGSFSAPVAKTRTCCSDTGRSFSVKKFNTYIMVQRMTTTISKIHGSWHVMHNYGMTEIFRAVCVGKQKWPTTTFRSFPMR